MVLQLDISPQALRDYTRETITPVLDNQRAVAASVLASLPRGQQTMHTDSAIRMLEDRLAQASTDTEDVPQPPPHWINHRLAAQ